MSSPKRKLNIQDAVLPQNAIHPPEPQWTSPTKAKTYKQSLEFEGHAASCSSRKGTFYRNWNGYGGGYPASGLEEQEGDLEVAYLKEATAIPDGTVQYGVLQYLQPGKVQHAPASSFLQQQYSQRIHPHVVDVSCFLPNAYPIYSTDQIVQERYFRYARRYVSTLLKMEFTHAHRIRISLRQLLKP